MGIKKTPISIRVYYKTMKNRYTEKLNELVKKCNELKNSINNIYKDINKNIDSYKEHINLEEFDEFKNNEYTTGKFYKTTKGLFYKVKDSDDYEFIALASDLYSLSKKQLDLYNTKEIENKYKTILNISFKDYVNILRTFYTEVHKQLIIKGRGYALEGKLGWICINRVHIKKARKYIDYQATKLKKKELRAQGKTIYNKEEAEWCRKNGIPYDGVDGRVFREIEYCYEIPLINCSLHNSVNYKLTIADYRGSELRGKTNIELIKNCNRDKNKICDLPLDLKSKLSMCENVDKMLYTNFIRNENQESVNYTKISR